MENELSKQELMEIITAYDCYIQNAIEDGMFDTGWRPPSLKVFYDMFYSKCTSYLPCTGIKLVS